MCIGVLRAESWQMRVFSVLGFSTSAHTPLLWRMSKAALVMLGWISAAVTADRLPLCARSSAMRCINSMGSEGQCRLESSRLGKASCKLVSGRASMSEWEGEENVVRDEGMPDLSFYYLYLPIMSRHVECYLDNEALPFVRFCSPSFPFLELDLESKSARSKRVLNFHFIFHAPKCTQRVNAPAFFQVGLSIFHHDHSLCFRQTLSNTMPRGTDSQQGSTSTVSQGPGGSSQYGAQSQAERAREEKRSVRQNYRNLIETTESEHEVVIVH